MNRHKGRNTPEKVGTLIPIKEVDTILRLNKVFSTRRVVTEEIRWELYTYVIIWSLPGIQ